MNGAHQIMLLTWQQNVLFHRFPTVTMAAALFIVYIYEEVISEFEGIQSTGSLNCVLGLRVRV